MLLVLLVPASAWDQKDQAGTSPERDATWGAVSGTMAGARVGAVEDDRAAYDAGSGPREPEAALADPVPSSPSAGASGASQKAADEVVTGQVGEDVVKVEPAVTAAIEQNGTAGYLVYFRERPSLSAAERRTGSSAAASWRSSCSRWPGVRRRTCGPYLDSMGVSYRSFWIDNVILVEASDVTVLNDLRRFPEIGVIRDLSQLDAESYRAVMSELRLDYLVPTIERIVGIIGTGAGRMKAASPGKNATRGRRWGRPPALYGKLTTEPERCSRSRSSSSSSLPSRRWPS